jgi:hypothetical protein
LKRQTWSVAHDAVEEADARGCSRVQAKLGRGSRVKEADDKGAVAATTHHTGTVSQMSQPRGVRVTC